MIKRVMYTVITGKSGELAGVTAAAILPETPAAPVPSSIEVAKVTSFTTLIDN